MNNMKIFLPISLCFFLFLFSTNSFAGSVSFCAKLLEISRADGEVTVLRKRKRTRVFVSNWGNVREGRRIRYVQVRAQVATGANRGKLYRASLRAKSSCAKIKIRPPKKPKFDFKKKKFKFKLKIACGKVVSISCADKTVTVRVKNKRKATRYGVTKWVRTSCSRLGRKVRSGRAYVVLSSIRRSGRSYYANVQGVGRCR